MLVRDAGAADQFATRAVAVAVSHRAVGVVVVRDWGHVAFVTIICQEIIASPPYGFIVARINTSSMLLVTGPVRAKCTRAGPKRSLVVAIVCVFAVG